MRLTNFSDLSFRVLLYAAAHRDRMFTIEEMNAFYDVSRGHLMKVVNLLAKEGYLNSIRGRTGGISLGMDPEDIRLDEVLKLTEPDFALVECMRPSCTCALEKRCKLTGPLDEAMNAFVEKLSEYTLADIALKERSFLRT